MTSGAGGPCEGGARFADEIPVLEPFRRRVIAHMEWLSGLMTASRPWLVRKAPSVARPMYTTSIRSSQSGCRSARPLMHPLDAPEVEIRRPPPTKPLRDRRSLTPASKSARYVRAHTDRSRRGRRRARFAMLATRSASTASTSGSAVPIPGIQPNSMTWRVYSPRRIAAKASSTSSSRMRRSIRRSTGRRPSRVHAA